MPSTYHFTTAAERRQHVAARYLKGAMQSEIAREVGVTQSQVSLDLKALRQLWLASAVRDFDEAKAQELAKIDQIEIAAWRSFEKSLEPREITLTEGTEGGDRTPTRKASVRREGSAGDPRWLQVIQKCVDTRCQILGLFAPTRFRIDWEHLSEEQLLRLAAGDDPQQVVQHAIAEA